MESGSSDSGAQAGTALRLDEDRLMWRDVDGEVIVLDKRTWTYLGINGSGAVLWREMTGGATAQGLAERLREAYGLDAETAVRDVEAFLTMLREHELLAGGG